MHIQFSEYYSRSNRIDEKIFQKPSIAKIGKKNDAGGLINFIIIIKYVYGKILSSSFSKLAEGYSGLGDSIC